MSRATGSSRIQQDDLVSIVIPVYRSEACLEATVTEILEFFEGRQQIEVILVNDGSPDRVEAVMSRLSARDSRVRELSLGTNLGQHRATLIGMHHARGRVVVTVDDDGQNPPAAAQRVLEVFESSGLDVVYGRFETVEQSLPRIIASKVNRWLSRLTMNNTAGISLTNVRAIDGDLARAIGGAQSTYPYIDALLLRMTARVADVVVEHRPRRAGTSNYSFGRLLSLWVSHMTSLTILPLRLAMLGSFGAAVLGMGVGTIQMLIVLSRGSAPPGWLSLFVAVTFLFSVLFLLLGIISAYVGRMYVAQNERGLVWIRSKRHDSR